MSDKSAVVNVDAEELVLADMSGETIFISLMTPEEVEQMYEEDPELRNMFQL